MQTGRRTAGYSSCHAGGWQRRITEGHSSIFGFTLSYARGYEATDYSTEEKDGTKTSDEGDCDAKKSEDEYNFEPNGSAEN